MLVCAWCKQTDAHVQIYTHAYSQSHILLPDAKASYAEAHAK